MCCGKRRYTTIKDADDMGTGSKTNADFLLSLSPHMCGTTLRFFISGTITAEILEKGLALLLPQSLSSSCHIGGRYTFG
ncbi:hypothetical protein Bca4012_033824 [Brassica carinata]